MNLNSVFFLGFIFIFIGCGGSDTNTIVDNQDIHESFIDGAYDTDNDYIPDNVEKLLGMDLNNSDEDNDGVLDGLQSTGIYGDQFFNKEWYILSLGTLVNDSGVASIVGNDLDLKEIYHAYMGYNGGQNIIIQVVDSGVDIDHEDLVLNMDLSRSLDGEEIGDPSSVTGNSHGTMVAGIISARAFNQKGVRGIAPFAKIAGSNFVDKQTYKALEKAWYSGDGANEIAVTNNSWGVESGMDTSADTTCERLMELGSNNLRDNKGRIYVISAGNERIDSSNNKQADANINYDLNSRYPVVVASLKYDNTYASYSNPGSNLLVSGYGGEYYQLSPTMATTTIMGASSNTGDINTKTTWSEDINENYTFSMNGTSAAAPTVSASIGLVLEACPSLTWRDIRYLIAKNAKQIDMQNPTWVQNGVGLLYSRDYGFGLINPKGMINECLNSYVNLGAEKTQSVTKNFNILIPDDKSTQSFAISLSEDNIKIEWVEVTIDNDSTYASDYIINLISPMGTKIKLIDTNQASALEKAAWLDGGFRLSTAAMMGENSQGEWKVEFIDMYDGNSGILKTITLKVYGH